MRLSLLNAFINEKNLENSSGLSRSGASLPIWLNTCAKHDPPILFFPNPRSTKKSSDSISVSSSGVICSLVSGVFEKALIISERGAVTDLFFPSSFQELLMDMESLPTGIVNPSSGQSSMPIDLTAS